MGLDWIPFPAPCKIQGKVPYIVKDGKKLVNCEECPLGFKEAYESGKHPVGILGTYCWYRGKVLAYLLDDLGFDGSSCYGQLDNGRFVLREGDLREILALVTELLEDREGTERLVEERMKPECLETVLWVLESAKWWIERILELGVREVDCWF